MGYSRRVGGCGLFSRFWAKLYARFCWAVQKGEDLGPNLKTMLKSQYNSKPNPGLVVEVKPAGYVPPGGDFSMQSVDPPGKSLEVFLATATASGMVRRDGLSMGSTWIVNWHTRPSLVRSELHSVV